MILENTTGDEDKRIEVFIEDNEGLEDIEDIFEGLDNELTEAKEKIEELEEMNSNLEVELKTMDEKCKAEQTELYVEIEELKGTIKQIEE